jgi:hypothetical protein
MVDYYGIANPGRLKPVAVCGNNLEFKLFELNFDNLIFEFIIID